MKKLLVTDLDDTLYNWMGFFVPSFFAMLDEVVKITGADRDQLIAEYKLKHQYYKSVEFPYVTTHLPSVQACFPNKTPDELKEILRPAFRVFNSVRDSNLHLFPGVAETMKAITEQGMRIVGFSESSQENGFYRSLRLGIAPYFTHIYLFESQFQADFTMNEKVCLINSKKPNPQVLLRICQEEGFTPEETIYMGDSMTKDVYMAHCAGITSVWADSPEKHPEYAQQLLSITSWTDDEYAAEQSRRAQMQQQGILPDFTVSYYPDLLNVLKQC